MVKDCEEKESNSGTTYWNLNLEVVNGAFAGKWLYDSLFFSQKALPRFKMACKALGLNVKGEAEITPQQLIGKKALVDIEIDNYDGKKRNKVAYAGYHKADSGVASPSASEVFGEPGSTDDLPF